MAVTYIAVVGHGPDLVREEGAVNVLRALGARVVTLDLWDDPASILPQPGQTLRALVIEAMDRPDLAAAALRAIRRESALEGVGAIVAINPGQVAQLDPELGFDDFVLIPYFPAELYARIRNVEWRRSDFVGEERIKLGLILIDTGAHKVTRDGVVVQFTAKEFALLVYFCERRGRLVTRSEALDRVWGDDYEGGSRTVDIHVRRLRAKLGDALPLQTLRGAGYKMALPDDD